MTKDSKSGYKKTGKVAYVEYEGNEGKFQIFVDQFMQLAEISGTEDAFDGNFSCITKKEYKSGEKIVVDSVGNETKVIITKEEIRIDPLRSFLIRNSLKDTVKWKSLIQNKDLVFYIKKLHYL